jgi:hypothetical protein
MYRVTLIEMKAVNAQVKHSGAENKTSSEPTAQDDEFQEVKKCKSHNSNDNSKAAKKSTRKVPTFTDVKLPPKAVSSCNYITTLRTTDMDTETTGTENTLPEQEAPKNQVGHHQQ